MPRAVKHARSTSTVGETVPAATARRMLLAAQGLLDDPARPLNAKSLYQLIEQMGFVQIDTINVVERAHHLTLFSRCDRYEHAMLSDLLERSRLLFEHWTHDASAIPTQWFPHWRHRFARYRKGVRSVGWWKERLGPRPLKTIAAVRDRIEREGPLRSADFEKDRTGVPPTEEGWWGWSPQKAALEYLWRSGELAVVRRINFQKVYDLTERVLPSHHALPEPPRKQHIDWACRSAMERLGIATPTELARFWHIIDIADARRWCHEAVKRGEIAAVHVETAGGSSPKAAVAVNDWRERFNDVKETNHSGDRVRLLCPFDPVIRDRARTLRLFNFDYTFEAFTPAPKRKYGYFVLPMLQGDRLIGRLDPKLHRDRGALEIKGIWLEPHVKVTKSLRRCIQNELQRLASFTGAQDIQWPRGWRNFG